MLILTLFAIAGCVLLGSATAPPSALTITWQQGPRLPSGVGGHAAFALEDGVLIVGGTRWQNDVKQVLAEQWAWRASSPEWKSEGEVPRPLAYAISAQSGRQMALAGGATAMGKHSDAFTASTEGQLQWTRLPDLPEPRLMGGGGIIAGKFLLLGGTPDAADLSKCSPQLLSLDLHDPAAGWKPLASESDSARILPATAACGGKLYAFGGMGSSAEDNKSHDLASALCYDPQQNRITRLADLPAPRRGAAAVAYGDRYILIIGGCYGAGNDAVFLNDVLVYDTTTDRYEKAAPLPYAALGPVAALQGERLWVSGGEDKARHRSDAFVIGKISLNEAR